MEMDVKNEFSKIQKGYYFGFVVTICLSSLQFGICVGKLNEEDKEQFVSFLEALLPIGGFVGSVIGGFLSTKGRRIPLQIANVIMIVSCICELFKYSNLFEVGRFAQGIATGIQSACAPIFLKEITPVFYAGCIVSLHSFCICLGELLACVIYFLLQNSTQKEDIDTVKKVSYLIPAAIAAIQLVLFLTLYRFDSSVYYLWSDDEISCLTVLNKLYKSQDNAQQKYSILQNNKDKQRRKVTNYLDMFQPKYRSRFFIVSGIFIFRNFGGFYVISMFSARIMSSIKLNEDYILFIALFATLGAVLCIILIDRAGRRNLMLIAITGCIISLAVILLATPFGYDNAKNIIFFALLIYSFVYWLGSGIIPFTYMTELLPDKGVALATSIYWFSAAAVTLPLSIIKYKKEEPYSSGVLTIHFVVFFTSSVILLVICWIFMVETKGLSEIEIRRAFKQRKIGEDDLLSDVTSPKQGNLN